MRRASNKGACRRSDGDGSPMHEGANGDAAKAPEHLPGNDVGVPMHEHTTVQDTADGERLVMAPVHQNLSSITRRLPHSNALRRLKLKPIKRGASSQA